MKHETVSGAPREFVIIEPGDCDLQEGMFDFRCFEKKKFATPIWNKRIKQALDQENGVCHVIEYSAYQKLQSCLDKAVACLKAINENTLELQPNSGHMYLANVNYCYKKTNECLAAISNIMSEPKSQEKE